MCRQYGRAGGYRSWDCWQMEGGKPIHCETGDGLNFVIARTEQGGRLLEDAQRNGVLKCGPFTVEQLRQMHDDHGLRKRSVFWRILGLRYWGSPQHPTVGSGWLPLACVMHRYMRPGLRWSACWPVFFESGIARMQLRSDQQESIRVLRSGSHAVEK